MHFYSLSNENIESISMGVGEIDLDNDKAMLQTKNEVFTNTNKDEHFNIKWISEWIKCCLHKMEKAIHDLLKDIGIKKLKDITNELIVH